MSDNSTSKVYLDVVYQCPYSQFVLVSVCYWEEFPVELIDEYKRLEASWFTYGPSKYRELIRKYRHRAYVEYRAIRLDDADKYTYCLEIKKKVYIAIDYCIQRIIARAKLAKNALEIVTSTNMHPDIWRVPYCKQTVMSGKNISVEKFYAGAYAALLYKKELKLNNECLEFQRTYKLDFDFLTYIYKNGLPTSINGSVLSEAAQFINKKLNTYNTSERSHLRYLVFLPLYKGLPKWWVEEELKWSGDKLSRLGDYLDTTAKVKKISPLSLRELPLLAVLIKKPPEYLSDSVVQEVLEWIEKKNRQYSRNIRVY